MRIDDTPLPLASMMLSGRMLRAAWRSTAVAAAFLVAACSTGLNDPGTTASIKPDATATDATRKKPVRVAMLLPLAGFDQTAAVAKAMKQAGELALFERDNPSVQLVVKDDRGTPEGAKAAAGEAIKEGAEVILGPLTAPAVGGAAPVAQAAGVPVIAFSNNASLAGNGVYLMSFVAETEVERIVSYAAAKGRTRFAALIPGDAYGRIVEPVFRSAVARAGGTIVALETYAVQANQMLEPAKRIVEAIKQGEASGQPVDALFLPGGADTLPNIGPLITYSGIDTTKVKLIGTGSWDFPNVGRDPALAGGWFPGPDPKSWQDFSGRFAKTFGSAPPRIATLAYDAVSMVVTMSEAPPGPAGETTRPGRFQTASITRPGGFSGVDGHVQFGPRGIAERGLAVLEVQKFGATVVDPAPAALDGARMSLSGGRVN